MTFQSLVPLLRTKDLKSTVDFYTTVLGFICESFDEDYGWASLNKDGLQLMIATPNEHLPFDNPIFTGSFYFRVDNVAELWEQLKSKVTICYPLESFEYGMNEFAVFDNNGYLLQFGQENS